MSHQHGGFSLKFIDTVWVIPGVTLRKIADNQKNSEMMYNAELFEKKTGHNRPQISTNYNYILFVTYGISAPIWGSVFVCISI